MSRTPDREEGKRLLRFDLRLTDVERGELERVAGEMGVSVTDALRALPRLWDALTERQRERVRR